MGFPMAGHLAAAGHQLTVWNRSPAKAEAWLEKHGHTAAPTAREAAFGAEFVMACVGNDDDLRQVCLGPDGAFAGMDPGAIFVDHTTVSAMVTRELAAEGVAHGLGFVDAPVSGGQAGAENGQLSIMCGGDRGRLCRGRAGDGGLFPHLPAPGRKRGGATGQDDEPDLHRRSDAGPDARRWPSAKKPGWTARRWSR